MLWFWIPVGIFLVAIFVGAWLFDRRHGKDSTFGEGMDTNAGQLEAKNTARLMRPGGSSGGWGG
ncbi:hypothetical protein JNB_17808 [Janibacter sp. HTCC2649]|uniref:hypothetical protein n=1 Tax=Janibacter sp. HTCC2649 TaxID=313589 RepID=UPI0000670E65|nr:hypothetical protein [Janibacter sp. HTCC2649]EAP97350.1 hypothetical protein JNB_17808 [Janibacter sp. HTCC2649]